VGGREEKGKVGWLRGILGGHPPPENFVSFDVFHPMDKAIVKGITKTYSSLLLIF
jgi:hypothetical protein